MKTSQCVMAAALLVGVVSSSGRAEANPAPAVAESSITCGATITQSIRLTHDLVNCPGNGILIGADNVTLDLNGYSISGDGSVRPGCPGDEACNVGVVNAAHEGGRPGVGPGHRGVIIKNGSIRGFGEYGIFGNNVRGNALRDLTVADNVLGGVFWCGATSSVMERIKATGGQSGLGVACPDQQNRDVRIEDNLVADVGSVGILVFHGTNVAVTGNRVSGGGGFAGILLVAGTEHTTVVGNRVTGWEVGIFAEANANRLRANRVSGNVDGIVVFGDRNWVAGNHVSDSTGCEDPACGSGISIDGGSGNVVTGNDVRRTATDGIRVAAFEPGVPTTGTIVSWNVVSRAGRDGFSVGSFAEGPIGLTRLHHNVATRAGDDGFDVRVTPTVVGSNLASRNTDLGIAAIPGVTDAGGNVARFNGNPAQCTNVACH